MVSISPWYALIFGILIGAGGVSFTLTLDEGVPIGPRYTARSYDTDMAIITGINRANQLGMKNTVEGAIVPHHLIASEAIARGIGTLTKKPIIVILSPDHFMRCPELFCTTYGSFETFFGEVFVDGEGVAALLRKGGSLIATSSLFEHEHGVEAVVPVVRHYLPNARIIPIVVSVTKQIEGDTRTRARDVIMDIIEETNATFVVSSDFSHYLQLHEANDRDKDTLSAICTLNSEELISRDNPTESDCPLCLFFMNEYAKAHSLFPEIIWHSNSAVLLGDETVEETTSHYTVVYAPEESICAR